MCIKIGDVSRKYNVSRRRIRYYEELGFIKCKRDEDSDYRYFSKEDLLVLEQIILLRNFDFTMVELKEIIFHPKSTSTKEIFYNKEKQLQSIAYTASNQYQIIKTIIDIIVKKGLDHLSITELISEQIYILTNNERLIKMVDNKETILLDFGIELIPIFEAPSEFISLLKTQKEILFKKYDKKSVLIRCKDSVELSPLSWEISINKDLVNSKKYTEYNGEYIKNDMLSQLLLVVEENILKL